MKKSQAIIDARVLARDLALQPTIEAAIAAYDAQRRPATAALVQWPRVLASIFGSADLVQYAPMLGAVIVTWTVASFLEIVPVACQDLIASTAKPQGARKA